MMAFILYLTLAALTGLVGKLKNRCGLCWFFYSFLFSPLLCLIILLFKKSLETYEYTGKPSLKNEAYKIYLTKKYEISGVETVNKFECKGNIYDTSYDALRYAQSFDQQMSKVQLELEDPLNGNGSDHFKFDPKNGDGELIRNEKISGTLIFVIATFGILFILFVAGIYN